MLGDSLSPYLFLLVVEVLSELICDAFNRDIIHGFQVAPGGIVISYLQFADDTLLFINVEVDEIIKMFLILFTFEMLTGMKLNSEKSSIISLGADDIIDSLAAGLGCKVEKFHIKYLRLPLGATSRNISS